MCDFNPEVVENGVKQVKKNLHEVIAESIDDIVDGIAEETWQVVEGAIQLQEENKELKLKVDELEEKVNNSYVLTSNEELTSIPKEEVHSYWLYLCSIRNKVEEQLQILVDNHSGLFEN